MNFTNIVSVTPPASITGANVVEINGREIPDVLSIQCHERTPLPGVEVTLTFIAAQANYVGQNAFRDPDIAVDTTPGAPSNRTLWQRFNDWCRGRVAAYEAWQNGSE